MALESSALRISWSSKLVTVVVEGEMVVLVGLDIFGEDGMVYDIVDADGIGASVV